jgi:hypothetical protein
MKKTKTTPKGSNASQNQALDLSKLIAELQSINLSSDLMLDTFDKELKSINLGGDLLLDVVDNLSQSLRNNMEVLLKGIVTNDSSQSLEELSIIQMNGFAEMNSKLGNAVSVLGSVRRFVADIRKTTTDILEFFTGGDMQQVEDRRKLLEALNLLAERPEPVETPEPERRRESSDGIDLTKWSAIGGVALSLGVIAGFAGQLLKTIGLMKPLTIIFSKIGKIIQPFIKMITNTERILAFVSKIPLIGKSSGKILSGFFEIIKGIFSFLNIGVKLGAGIFKAIPIIGTILTVLMGLWEGVTKSIEGYKKGGILGGIKGFISGFLDGAIGSVLDMIKGAVSWIAKFFGFENVSKFLDSFSFGALMKDGVDAIFGVAEYAVKWLADLFSVQKFTEAFNNFGVDGIFAVAVGGVLDMIKGAVSWIATLFGAFDMANALDDFSFQDYIIEARDATIQLMSELFTWITDMLAAAPAAIAAGLTDLSSMTSDFAKNILREILPNPNDHKSLSDPLHWVAKAIPQGIYDFAGVNSSSPKVESAKLNSSANNTGSELNNASAKVGSTAVIVNQYGGNVTNHSTSSVNNSSMSVDPIISGSSMGFSSL